MYRSETAAPTQTNPLVYKGVMYLTVDSSIVAIDAATCRQRWSTKWDAKGGACCRRPIGRGDQGRRAVRERPTAI